MPQPQADFFHVAGDGLEVPEGYRELFATDGADVIRPTDVGNAIVHAGAGDDIIYDSGGLNQLFGEAGDDIIVVAPEFASGLPEVLDGGDGIDTLRITGTSLSLAQADLSNFEKLVFQAGGSVVLDTGQLSQFDSITGGDSRTILLYGTGRASFTGTLAAETRLVATFDNTRPASINLTLTQSVTELEIIGRELDDRIIVKADAVGVSLGVRVDAGGGDDFVRVAGEGVGVRLSGEAGNDSLFGSLSSDWLFGGLGDDIIMGGRGADQIQGQTGANTFVFAAGDSLVGAGVRDIIQDFTARNHDRIDLHLMDGDTETEGQQGFHLVDGGAFTHKAGELIQYLFRTGNTFTHILAGDSDGDGRADFEIELLTLDTLKAADIVVAGPLGSAEADRIRGTNAGEVIDGGSGDDRISGGGSGDLLTGGEGMDRFILKAAGDSRPGVNQHDIITDFSLADGDRIDLQAIDANTGLAGDQAFFLGGASFTYVAGELIRFNDGHGHTLVQGDVNGDGIADLELFLDGTITLTSADYIL